MTSEEKAICKKYSKRDKEGLVHCNECPLVTDKESHICKAVEDLMKKDLMKKRKQRKKNDYGRSN